jgi:hypothetical protein
MSLSLYISNTYIFLNLFASEDVYLIRKAVAFEQILVTKWIYISCCRVPDSMLCLLPDESYEAIEMAAVNKTMAELFYGKLREANNCAQVTPAWQIVAIKLYIQQRMSN